MVLRMQMNLKITIITSKSKVRITIIAHILYVTTIKHVRRTVI